MVSEECGAQNRGECRYEDTICKHVTYVTIRPCQAMQPYKIHTIGSTVDGCGDSASHHMKGSVRRGWKYTRCLHLPHLAVHFLTYALCRYTHTHTLLPSILVNGPAAGKSSILTCRTTPFSSQWRPPTDLVPASRETPSRRPPIVFPTP
jgi:hypothetical protein